MVSSYYYNKSNKTDHELYLEDEVDRLCKAEERRARQDEENHKQRQAEIRQSYEENLRYADDWPEALRNQIFLCNREIYSDDEHPVEEDFFYQNAKACERALVILAEVQAEKQSEIEELEKRIEKIRESIVNEVADKLQAENSRSEWVGVANSLRNDTPSGFLYW